MWKDPIVEQVREIRRQIADEYAGDEEYYQHLLAVQEQHRDRLVSRSPAARQPERGS